MTTREQQAKLHGSTKIIIAHMNKTFITALEYVAEAVIVLLLYMIANITGI